MVDATTTSALAGHLKAGVFGAAETEDDAGVTIAEVRDQTLIHVAGPSDGVAAAGEARVLRLGPDQWLIKAARDMAGDLASSLAATHPEAAVNDVTFGRTTLRLAGPHARDVLAAGCPLDLHESAFAPGQSASLLGHLQVVIECLETESFDITVTRSYGLDLLEWLRRAAAEYGFKEI